MFSSGNWKLKLQEEPRLRITHEKEKEKVAFGIYGKGKQVKSAKKKVMKIAKRFM